MMTKKELELYIHIPFCVKKCAYCDFLSWPADERTKASYVDALVREIKAKGRELKEYCVSTVFLGGGTPSVLSGDDIARIFAALKENFSIQKDAEVTMEINPGTVTKEKAVLYRKCGINRISIGLQSVNDDELRILGRIHTYGDFLKTLEVFRNAGFENISADLISALPGQTIEKWEKTIRTAAELKLKHISAYSLIIEEGTPFYEKYEMHQLKTDWPPLPDEETEREIYSLTEKILSEYGYHRYEISNYASDGYECRHNLGYWERKEYIGLGVGAASLLNETRFHNTTAMNEYLNEPENAGRERVHLDLQDRMEEFMFLGLRETKGISLLKFKNTFGVSVNEIYGSQINKMRDQGLLIMDNNMLRLTPKGTDLSNYVFAGFLF